MFFVFLILALFTESSICYAWHGEAEPWWSESDLEMAKIEYSQDPASAAVAFSLYLQWQKAAAKARYFEELDRPRREKQKARDKANYRRKKQELKRLLDIDDLSIEEDNFIFNRRISRKKLKKKFADNPLLKESPHYNFEIERRVSLTLTAQEAIQTIEEVAENRINKIISDLGPSYAEKQMQQQGRRGSIKSVFFKLSGPTISDPKSTSLFDSEGFPVRVLNHLPSEEINSFGTVRNQIEVSDYFDRSDTTYGSYEKGGRALRIKRWFSGGTGQENFLGAAFFAKDNIKKDSRRPRDTYHEFLGVEFSPRDEVVLLAPDRIIEKYSTEKQKFFRDIDPKVWGAEDRLLFEEIFSYLNAAQVSRYNGPFSLEISAPKFTHANRLKFQSPESLQKVSRVAANRYGLDIMMRKEQYTTKGKVLTEEKIGFLTLDFFSSDPSKVLHSAKASNVELQYEIEILSKYIPLSSGANGSYALATLIRKLDDLMPGKLNLTPKYLQLKQCESALVRTKD